MKNFDQIREDSLSLNENKDCAVRAITAISNLPYSYVHRVFYECGRRRRCSTPFYVTEAVLRRLNIWADRIKTDAKTIRSLKGTLPKKGRFLVRTRGHILGCVNGEVIDWTDGRLHRIREIYKISF